jgi:glycosyltransferase involved in cell wall biosynthesis
MLMGRDHTAVADHAGTPGARGPDLVVQVVPYFPPHLGGTEVVAEAIAESLAEHGPVEVLTSSTGAAGARRVERRGSLLVRRLRTLEIEHVPFMPTLIVHLLGLPRRTVVHVHIAQAYVPEMVRLSAWIRQRPYVAHFHLDCDPTGRFGWIFVLYKRWILGGSLRSASRVIVLSPAQADFVRRRYGVAEERIVVMPNGVARAFGQQARIVPDHGGAFRLLFVGRLSPQKNLARLLRAIPAMRVPVELVVVGDGEERAMLEALCRELGLAGVRMVGSQTSGQVLDWYRWADAFVLPSDKEGMPLAVLEAMASGLPVVATNVPGLRDTVGDDGILAAPDPAALAAAVDRLAADPELWRALSRRGWERGRELSWETRVDDLRALYQSLVP